MIKFIPLFLLLFLQQTIKAQFNSPIVIDSTFSAYIRNINFADLDNDNQNDIIVTYFSDSIRWYKNTGNLSFTKMPLIVTGVATPSNVDIGDIDGNGFKDILVSNDVNNGKIYLYKNSGAGTIWTQVIIDQNIVLGAVKNYFADIDKDGDLDIISCHDLIISVYYNNGSGTFTGRNSVATNNNEFYNLVVQDFNNDTYKDFIVNSGNGVEKYINNQNNTYTRTLLFNQLENLLESCDIDNDTDFEYFLINSANASEINTYKNNGTGTFSLFQSTGFTVGNVQNPALKFVKINDDNYVDALYKNSTLKGLYYRPNDGTGTLLAPIFIDSTFPYLYANADDLNNDGKNEIVWAGGVSLAGKKYLGFINKTTIVTAINNVNPNIKLSIYPNPATEVLYIKKMDNTFITNVSIVDNSGKVIYTAPKLPQQLNIASWVKGKYYLKVNKSTYAFEKL